MERLKLQSKDQIAIIRRNTSQAEKFTANNKWLADENERYATYLQCLVTAMNNSMSSKVKIISSISALSGVGKINID